MLKEIWQMMKERKKIWLFPIVLALVTLSFLIFFSQAAVLPFVYTLF